MQAAVGSKLFVKSVLLIAGTGYVQGQPPATHCYNPDSQVSTCPAPSSNVRNVQDRAVPHPSISVLSQAATL